MAQANNPQTPAAGQPGNEAGNNTNQPKKYAGKYNSLEEAVELGYGGLEKGFNELNEKFANMTRLLEAAVAPQEPVPTVGAANYGQPYAPSGYVDPYGRNPAAPVPGGNNAAVEFLMNPQAHLEAREQALLQKVGGAITSAVTNAMAVNDFKSRNPDLIKHEPLFRSFMNQTDPRKPVAERLEDAGKAVRQYIAQNFQAPANPPPAGNNYVEAPRGGQPPFIPGSPAPSAPTGTEGEQELVDYLNSRNAIKAQNMGVGVDEQK